VLKSNKRIDVFMVSSLAYLEPKEHTHAPGWNEKEPCCYRDATTSGLNLPNILDRSNIHVSSTYNVIDNSEYENSAIAQHSPVHIDDCWPRTNREEAKYPAEE
jgi:hypothetical protein